METFWIHNIYVFNLNIFHTTLLLDPYDGKEEQDDHLQCLLRPPANVYLSNNGRSLPQSPPGHSVNSLASHSPTYLLSFSRHLCTYSLHHSGLDTWTAGYYSSHPFFSHIASRPMFSDPLNHQITASLHTSFSIFSPDKHKPTVEKAVDIAKEKKKMAVVDILTKVCKIKTKPHPEVAIVVWHVKYRCAS